MEELTEYEKLKQENIRKNRELLAGMMGSGNVKVAPGDALAISALGLAPPPTKRKKAAAKPKTKPKPKVVDEDGGADDEGAGKKTAPTRPVLGTRRSARNAAKPSVSYAGDGENVVDKTKMPVIISQPGKRWDEAESGDEEDGEGGGTVRVNRLVGRVHDPKTFGIIPGVRIGTWWETRAECSGAAIHAPFVAGISGGADGAYSVALSGGYDDDVDMGEAFTYTGSGGRDLKGTKANPKNLRTAPQSSHQTFENSFNKALKVSSETKKPVRVIRGFKLPSKYAPKTGYRYDGIYVVEKAWIEPGNNPGRFNVCKFAFRRVPGQPKIPVRSERDESDEEEPEPEEEAEEKVEEEEETKEETEEETAGESEKENAVPKSKSKSKPEPEPEPESENEALKDEDEDEEDEKPSAKRRKKAAPAAAKKAPTNRAPPKKKPAGRGRKRWVYVGE